MRKIMVLAIAALFVMGVMSIALAGEAKMAGKHETMHKVVGEVMSVDATAKTLTIKETLKAGGQPKEVTFSIGDKARIMSGGKAEELATLKAGDSGTVRYHDENGKMMAHEVTAAKPAAKPAAK